MHQPHVPLAMAGVDHHSEEEGEDAVSALSVYRNCGTTRTDRTGVPALVVVQFAD